MSEGLNYTVEEMFDLFSMLIIKTNLSTHKLFFKDFLDSFVFDEAAEILAHISLVRFSGYPDAREFPESATTTYSHTRRMVKDLLQRFMDARLVAYANASKSKFVHERGMFVPTEKGLHVVEQRISRRDASGSSNFHAHPEGILVGDSRVVGQSNADSAKCRFLVVDALDWLCDFTSVRGRDDAAVISAHFVRCGLIRMFSNEKRKGPSLIFTVQGQSSKQESNILERGELLCTSKAIYEITEDGCRVAGWTRNTGESIVTLSSHASPGRLSLDKLSTEGRGHWNLFQEDETDLGKKEVANELLVLEDVLTEPLLCSVFHEFLRRHGQERGLAFWMEIDHLKKVFSSSSIIIVGSRSPPALRAEAGEERQKFFSNRIVEIIASYLIHEAPCELKLDSNLREEVVRDVQQILTDSNLDNSLKHDTSRPNTADLHAIFTSFERVQGIVSQSMTSLINELATSSRTPQNSRCHKPAMTSIMKAYSSRALDFLRGSSGRGFRRVRTLGDYYFRLLIDYRMTPMGFTNVALIHGLMFYSVPAWHWDDWAKLHKISLSQLASWFPWTSSAQWASSTTFQLTAISRIQSHGLPFRPSAFVVVVEIPTRELLIFGSRQSTDTGWGCSITYPEAQALRTRHASFACTPSGPRVCSAKLDEAGQWYWPRKSAVVGIVCRRLTGMSPSQFTKMPLSTFLCAGASLESPSGPCRIQPESAIAIAGTSYVFPHVWSGEALFNPLRPRNAKHEVRKR
ncbi:hypothetical protein SCHPADRAFT_926622 [Schizopora paradoxa]|uniref:RGS domain-containing protein n=1 Tax=Schizopora paradoxa TaxID=27342 RepID=A0A0H2RXQ0_9AGAM|nr:hypothetical protein SCHPADRAFT_926622 [Schizopora paradoxa]